MKIFYGIKSVTGTFKSPVIAIGVFDGLHLGHQLVIRKAIARAKALRGISVVMTFDPHPVQVLHPENHLPLLVSLSHRLKLMQALGVDTVVVVRFTKTFSRLAPEQFIQKYLLKPFSPQEVIVGDDFRFGQNRAGTIAVFEKAGLQNHFIVRSVKTQQQGYKKFSSTAARQAILAGNLKKAAHILGRPVALVGRVVVGDRRGKSLGYPTANVIPQGELLPPQGVYIVRVAVGKKILTGMANVGIRPSFHQNACLIVEVHFFDFHKNIYGREIMIEFLQRIRNEKRFPSTSHLVAQLKKDEVFSRQWLSRHPQSK